MNLSQAAKVGNAEKTTKLNARPGTNRSSAGIEKQPHFLCYFIISCLFIFTAFNYNHIS